MFQRTRREWIRAVGVAGVVSLAGCSSSEDDSVAKVPDTGTDKADSEGTSEKKATTASAEWQRNADAMKETVKTMFSAARQNHVGIANKQIHPESPDGYFEHSELRMGNDYTVTDMEVARISGENATVDTTLNAEATVAVELRKYNGAWKVYHVND